MISSLDSLGVLSLEFLPSDQNEIMKTKLSVQKPKPSGILLLQ